MNCHKISRCTAVDPKKRNSLLLEGITSCTAACDCLTETISSAQFPGYNFTVPASPGKHLLRRHPQVLLLMDSHVPVQISVRVKPVLSLMNNLIGVVLVYNRPHFKDGLCCSFSNCEKADRHDRE